MAEVDLDVALFASAPIALALSFTVAGRELVALVGPSGAGKSTVLRCIAGLHRPQRGHVRCRGETWFDAQRGIDLPPHRRPVGLVFQDYALFPHQRVLGNVTAAMGHLPRHERAARARALLARVRLTGLEDRRPAELSGGQQQRVAVARALAREPAVLLLDEPFSAVDRATRRRLWAELAALRRDLAIPTVLVTHDLDEALLLADRVVLLHHGRGLQTAPPAEILARPASAEAARLLDLHNLFRARVEAHDAAAATTWLRWGPRRIAAAHDPRLALGEEVDWVIPPPAVILAEGAEVTPPAAANPIIGRICDLLRLGEQAHITLDVADPDGLPLRLSAPWHAVHRHTLAVNSPCRVFLLPSAIHCMPRRPMRGMASGEEQQH